MQTFVDKLIALLGHWNTVTIQSPLVSAAIILFIALLSLWFVISRYYHFKIWRLRRKFKKLLGINVQAHTNISEALSSTAIDYQQAQLHLNAKIQDVERLEAAQQEAQVQIDKALALESQIETQLMQLRARVNGPLAFSGLLSSNNDSPWQQYTVVVNDLINQLSTQAIKLSDLQQEKALFDEQITLQEKNAAELHEKLAQQNTHIAHLESELAEQQLQLRELTLQAASANKPLQTQTTPEQASNTDTSLHNIASQETEVSPPPSIADLAVAVSPVPTEIMTETPVESKTVELSPSDPVEQFIHKSESKVENLFNSLSTSLKWGKKAKPEKAAATASPLENTVLIAQQESSPELKPTIPAAEASDGKSKKWFSFNKTAKQIELQSQDVVTQSSVEASPAVDESPLPVNEVIAKDSSSAKPSSGNSFTRLFKSKKSIPEQAAEDGSEKLQAATAVDQVVSTPVMASPVASSEAQESSAKAKKWFNFKKDNQKLDDKVETSADSQFEKSVEENQVLSQASTDTVDIIEATEKKSFAHKMTNFMSSKKQAKSEEALTELLQPSKEDVVAAITQDKSGLSAKTVEEAKPSKAKQGFSFKNIIKTLDQLSNEFGASENKASAEDSVLVSDAQAEKSAGDHNDSARKAPVASSSQQNASVNSIMDKTANDNSSLESDPVLNKAKKFLKWGKK